MSGAEPATPRPRPLEDVTVLDLTVALAGPFATSILAALGARVIKIESPSGGDFSRSNPPYLGRDGAKLVREREDDISIPAISRLRNKLGVTLNLKHPSARQVFADLVKLADVIVENYTRGTLDRLGVGFDFAHGVNPRIVFCSITGFGSEGDPGTGKAMDAIIQALSGVMYTSGGPDDPPIRVGFPVADMVAPLFGVIGTLAALNQARRAGVGQHVDVSMLGALTSMLAAEPFDILERLGIPLRTGRSLPRLAPFGIYRAADGYVAICGPTDLIAHQLFEAMGRPELAQDPRFRTRGPRVQHVQALDALIEAWTVSLPRAELLERLERFGVPSADVRGPAEAIRDPRVLARGETVRLEHPRYGPVADVLGNGLPIIFSGAAAGFDRPPPGLGEHNETVYGGILGYPQERIEALRAEGVI